MFPDDLAGEYRGGANANGRGQETNQDEAGSGGEGLVGRIQEQGGVHERMGRDYVSKRSVAMQIPFRLWGRACWESSVGGIARAWGSLQAECGWEVWGNHRRKCRTGSGRARGQGRSGYEVHEWWVGSLSGLMVARCRAPTKSCSILSSAAGQRRENLMKGL